MCGFVGYWEAGGQIEAKDCIKSMALQIRHRGPNAEGYWENEHLKLKFAHRRLSIQDLSESGAQPMISASGRYVITFNGEIYNFRELREELARSGYQFRGHSDTEVMLASFEKWGPEEAVSRFSGMFAFALCDLHRKELYLVRDRLGEKPIYYGWQGATFLFGSELKAFKPHYNWRGDIDRDALTLLVRHNYIPAPHTIYKDIRKLEPASILRINLAVGASSLEIERYWKLEGFYSASAETMPLANRVEKLEGLLRAAVRRQMVADVPLGAFLSGGVDSSTVVALMQDQTTDPVRTFSIGFEEEEFNEAEHAKAVANHLGTCHTELYVTPRQALDVIPRLPELYDEPFADSSQIPTYLVCEMTRRHVTVALSGDGGDELFCGYDRFFSYERSWRRHIEEKRTPLGRARGLVLKMPIGMTAGAAKILFSSQRQLSTETVMEKVRKYRVLRECSSLQSFYRAGISYWFEPERLVLQATEPTSIYRDFPAHRFARDSYSEMMLLDSLSYLPDDILVKVDRAAMACGLETRVPFLDVGVVEYAASIPAAENIVGQSGKQLIKNILHRYVPRELVERPKKGFAVPLASWLRGPLREWAEALLEPMRLGNEGYFHAGAVRHKWMEHLTGKADHSFHLWGVLCFQAWLEYQKANAANPKG